MKGVATTVAVTAAVVFLAITGLYLAGALDAFDGAVAARAPDGAAARGAALVLDVVGSIPVALAAALVAAWMLHRAGRRTDARLVLVAYVATEVLTQGLKLVFARERPEEVVGALVGYSYPSGHATRAAFAATLAVAFAPRKGVAVALGALVALAAAAGRLVLDYHAASDVVAGLFLGVAAGATAASLRGPSGALP